MRAFCTGRRLAFCDRLLDDPVVDSKKLYLMPNHCARPSAGGYWRKEAAQMRLPVVPEEV